MQNQIVNDKYLLLYKYFFNTPDCKYFHIEIKNFNRCCRSVLFNFTELRNYLRVLVIYPKKSKK